MIKNKPDLRLPVFPTGQRIEFNIEGFFLKGCVKRVKDSLVLDVRTVVTPAARFYFVFIHLPKVQLALNHSSAHLKWYVELT